MWSDIALGVFVSPGLFVLSFALVTVTVFNVSVNSLWLPAPVGPASARPDPFLLGLPRAPACPRDVASPC